jgi:hypothetical protein
MPGIIKKEIHRYLWPVRRWEPIELKVSNVE